MITVQIREQIFWCFGTPVDQTLVSELCSRNKFCYRAAYVGEGYKLILGPSYETPTYTAMILSRFSPVNLQVLKEKNRHVTQITRRLA